LAWKESSPRKRRYPLPGRGKVLLGGRVSHKFSMVEKGEKEVV